MINRNFWKSKKVLITGHTGFKGSWLTLILTEVGAQITGISLEPVNSPNLFDKLNLIENSNIQHNILNIQNEKNLREIFNREKPDIVFHLAAQPLVRESYEKPLETWNTNVIGTLNLLEATKSFEHKCLVVIVTTDKVYKNREWGFGYRENDPLGGHDPYSSSKAAAELAVSSWRSSFCGELEYQNPNIYISTARSGNVIGGGDWSKDRIVPDFIRGAAKKEKIVVRNPNSTRPWQHVLEPLSGYIKLAEIMDSENKEFCTEFNFGPNLSSNRSVIALLDKMNNCWPAKWKIEEKKNSFHEANFLNLRIEKAFNCLDWSPKWDFDETVFKTINWYKLHYEGKSAFECCLDDMNSFYKF